ncbi:MAG: HlyD family secretion protein [Verrucomicrobiota bacterium]
MSERPATDPETPSAPTRYGRAFLTIVVLALALLALGVLWLYTDVRPSTDDAFIGANVIGVACRVDGPVVRVYVQDNQYVQAGDPLFAIDPTDYAVALRLAEADLLRAEAALADAEQYLERVQLMAARNFMSQNELDQAEAATIEARADLNAAKASRDQAELNLQYATVRAEVDGVVTNVQVSPGTYATAGDRIMALIDMNSWHMRAYFRENALENIRPGQLAEVRLNMYPSKVFRGRIQGIGWGVALEDGATSTDLLPTINPTVDWVQLATRFSVRIDLDGWDEDYPLRINARGTVKVFTDTKATEENTNVRAPAETETPAAPLEDAR